MRGECPSSSKLPREFHLVDLSNVVDLNEALHVLDGALLGAEGLDDLDADLRIAGFFLGLVAKCLLLSHVVLNSLRLSSSFPWERQTYGRPQFYASTC